MAIDGGGEVTSGTHSPMLDVGIGMGYVPDRARRARDTELTIDVRGKPRRARIVQEADLQARGVRQWPRRVLSRRPASTTPSTTGPASRATRPCSGITWFAQDALGELVHFEPPGRRRDAVEGRSYGEVESVKAVSDVIAPLSGEVLEVNQRSSTRRRP